MKRRLGSLSKVTEAILSIAGASLLSIRLIDLPLALWLEADND